MKRLFLLLAFVLTYTMGFAESKQFEIVSTDFPIIYTENGAGGDISKAVLAENDLTITYAGIKTQAKADSQKPYGYAFFLKDAGYIYSSNSIEGYYPSLIVITFSSSTGETGNIGIQYGAAKMDAINAEVDGSVVKNGTYTLVNTDNTLLYWNISTAKANVQIASIAVTYTPLEEQPDITHVTSVSIDTADIQLYVNQSLQLTSTIVPDDATDNSVVWESSNTDVVTVAQGKITAVAPGKAEIIVTSTDNNKAADTCVVTVIDKPKMELAGDVLTCNSLAANSTKYVTSSNVKGASGAEYLANSAKSNNSISLRPSTTQQDASGITATVSGGVIKAVYIDWNLVTSESNTLGIYVSHTPISLDTLYARGDNKALSPVKKVKVGINCKYTITGDWEYVAVRAFGGTDYIDQIAFEWGDPSEEDKGDDDKGDGDDKDDTAIGETPAARPHSYKTIRDGQVVIIRDGHAFNLLGKQLLD